MRMCICIANNVISSSSSISFFSLALPGEAAWWAVW